MADAYGTKAKPVQQDPFQHIVSVHWRDKQKDILALAFAIRMQLFVRSVEGGAEISLRYWNPLSYTVAVPPLFWNAWVLDTEGWGGAPSQIHVTGLPPLGPAPDYDWTPGALAPPVAGCRWVDPSGGAMDILVPIGDHRAFQAGVAAIEDFDDAVSPIGIRTNFPLDAVTATFEQFDFQYAGAVAVPKVIPGAGNTLIGGPGGAEQSTDFELWCLCTRVTS